MNATTETKPRRYPDYKDSGVEWLGEIPEHWEVKRLKHVCTKSAIYGANESASEYRDEGVRFLRTSDIDDKGQLSFDGAVYIDRSLVVEYLLNDGDILLSRSGTIGRSFLYKKDRHGECAYAGYLVRFVPDSSLFPKFAFYFTKSQQFFDWLGISVIESTIGNVNGQKYANMPLTLPPFREQRAIANFLDQKTDEIDTLIAKKERLIELLQEKRKALISHAVTKGLDATVEMKDSGVEWLGEIPEHWEVTKIKYVTTCLDGKRIPLNSEQRSVIKGNHPYWGANGVVDHIDQWIFDEDLVLLGEDGAPFFDQTKDVAFFVSGKIWVNNHIHVLRPKQSINPKFLTYALNTVSYSVFIGGSTRDKLTQSDMNEILIQSPPLAEQRAIANYLDGETAKLDALTEKIREAINKLKEYRTALISAAVTGKACSLAR